MEWNFNRLLICDSAFKKLDYCVKTSHIRKVLHPIQNVSKSDIITVPHLTLLNEVTIL